MQRAPQRTCFKQRRGAAHVLPELHVFRLHLHEHAHNKQEQEACQRQHRAAQRPWTAYRNGPTTRKKRCTRSRSLARAQRHAHDAHTYMSSWSPLPLLVAVDTVAVVAAAARAKLCLRSNVERF